VVTGREAFRLLEQPRSGRFGLSVINVNGTGFRRLTRDGEGLPAWSPDGTMIAYERFNPAAGVSGIDELWLMSPDGSNRRQLTFPPQHPRHPLHERPRLDGGLVTIREGNRLLAALPRSHGHLRDPL
jgi:Tol biopolymer transport system component